MNLVEKLSSFIVFQIPAFALVECVCERDKRSPDRVEFVIEPKVPFDSLCNSLRVEVENFGYAAHAAREFGQFLFCEIIAACLQKERIFKLWNKIRRGHAN